MQGAWYVILIRVINHKMHNNNKIQSDDDQQFQRYWSVRQDENTTLNAVL